MTGGLGRSGGRRRATPARRVKRRAVLQPGVLYGRTAPQGKGLTQQSYPPRVPVIVGLVDEAFEPHGVDGAGFHPQQGAVRLPSTAPSGSALHSRETRRCRAFAASDGGRSPQIRSTGVAFGTS